MDRIVGMGELIISNKEDDVIKTFALASCIGITVYSVSKKVAGMIHIVLPIAPKDLSNNIPASYYASTGVPLLINKICLECGYLPKDLEIRLFGGANSIRVNDVFSIGIKNISAVKSILKAMNLEFNAAEVGGNVSRTIEMDVSTGIVKVTTQPIVI